MCDPTEDEIEATAEMVMNALNDVSRASMKGGTGLVCPSCTHEMLLEFALIRLVEVALQKEPDALISSIMLGAISSAGLSASEFFRMRNEEMTVH